MKRHIQITLKMSDYPYMKKHFRLSQKASIIGYPLNYKELFKLGIPFQNVGGAFGAKGFGENSIDILLAALECHYPKIHAVSYMADSRVLNRYDKDALFCLLHRGDPDPDIEFSKEFRWEDLPEGAELDMMMFDGCVNSADAIEEYKKRRGFT